MTRCLLSLVVFVVSGATGLGAEEQPVPQSVTACIDEYAPSVEKEVSSLPDAVNFIVDDVCADSIAGVTAKHVADEKHAGDRSTDFVFTKGSPYVRSYAAKVLLKLRHSRTNQQSTH